MLILGNYDYQFDAIFHPSGSIELEVRASGFLLARYWDVDAREASGKFTFRHGISIAQLRQLFRLPRR